MAIYTFSTKTSKPEDTKLIEDIKDYCEKHSLNFSSVTVNMLKQFADSKEIKRG